MKRLFIPIIGTMSAGKSTFLKAFLGIDVLETGVTRTTKFVCLIKNSSQTSFYHVIPNNNQNDLVFVKDGNELRDKEQIAKKIKEINNTLKSSSKNDFFYMLETPIKNIKNNQLLENCYFMDIPGLNENKTTYIEDIFSIIKLKDILFEIFVFDSNNIGSDKVLDIFEELEKKNCLKKENNLYILNKIDICTNTGEENIIDYFIYYFYKNFEKEEKKIKINFSKNHFVPMNSLLYDAEIKYNEDFYSMLAVELFYYLKEVNHHEYDSFFKYIEKRLEGIIQQNNINTNDLENQSKNIINNSGEKSIVQEAIKKLEDIKSKTRNKEYLLGIKLDRTKPKNVMAKLYYIHKSKIYSNYIHSKSYEDLEEIIKTININDLPSPPSVFSAIKANNPNNEDILEEMNNFLRENLKNQFEELPYLIESLHPVSFHPLFLDF